MTNDEFQKRYFEIITKLRCSSKPKKIPKEQQGMNPALRFLLHEKKAGKEVTPSVLSKTFMVSTARVARLLNQLEKKELIYRSKKESNSRITIINLTAGGETKALEIVRENEKFRDILLNGITDSEKETFLNILNKISDNLERNN